MVANIRLKNDPEMNQNQYGSLITMLEEYIAFYGCAEALSYLHKGDKVRIVYTVKKGVKIIEGFYKKK